MYVDFFDFFAYERIRTDSPPQLSPAVTQMARSELGNLYDRLHAQTATAADVRGAIVSLETLFAYMQEQGENDRLQSYILAHADELVDTPISDPQIEILYSKAKADASTLTLDQFRTSLSSTRDDRARFIAEVKAIGIKGIEMRQLQQLQMIAAEMQDAPSSSGVGYGPRVRYPQARLHRILCYYAAYSAEAGILGAASVEFPPVAAAMGILAGIYGIEAAFLC